MSALIVSATVAPADGPDERARILAAARAGDLAAFERLIRQYERLVLVTSMRMLGNVADAQDASQEVFLRLYRNLGKVESNAAFTSWLYRVTVNVCHDLRRKRPADAPMEDAALAATAEADPQQATVEAERRRALDLGLKHLSEKERAALVLRDLEGLPTEEVARLLGSSQATVRSQIAKARIKMRGFLEHYFPEAAMNCREWEERIALYAGGDLEGAEQREVERHLEECAECREFAGGMAECLGTMREAHGEEILPAHFAALRARVLEQLRPAPGRRFRWAWLALACTCAAVLLAVWTAPSRSRLRSEPRASASGMHPAAPPLAAAQSPQSPPPRHIRHARPPHPPEPLLMKIETDDPDVVIYWIAN